MKLLSGAKITGVIFMVVFLGVTSCFQSDNSVPQPVNLKVNYRNNPLGTDIRKPRFSWEIADTVKNGRQTAYQILVASNKELLRNNNPDIWNSGKINSEQSIHVPFKGDGLEPATRYYWQVRIWNGQGEKSPYSAIKWFETAKFDKKDWEAQWISTEAWQDSIPPDLPAPYFRKSFQIDQPIAQSRCYISGLGYYELFINGKRVGDHHLDPAVTHYDKTVKYVTHDVGKYLKTGENVVVVKLGNGWYNQHSPSAWDFHEAPWRNSPALICQLTYQSSEGEVYQIISDGTWKYNRGPQEYNSIRNGAFYNAGKYDKRWFLSGFNDSNWASAMEVAGPEGELSAQKMPPIKITGNLNPKEINEPEEGEGTYVFDFGQNIAGWTRLNIEGERGTTVNMEHGERLYDNGTLDQEELSRFVFEGPTQTNKYILSGQGRESWKPSFSYHGFRYASVTGLPQPPDSGTLTADVVHTAFDTAGTFHSSDTILNQLHQNTQWSYLGNFHGYPEDCPHREKIGWSGDGQLAAEMGLWNYHTTTAYKKWMDDFLDEQRPDGRVPGIIPTSGWGYTYGQGPSSENGYGPQWEGAMVTIPWQLYLYKGDTTIIRRYYRGIKDYVQYLESHAKGDLLNFGINDHKYAQTPTEPPIIASAFYYHLSRLVGKMASVLGEEQDREYYDHLASSVKQAFNQKYFRKGESAYGNGGQTSMAMALYFDLVPEEHERKVLNKLVNNIQSHDGHFDTGVVGTKCLVNVLIEYELADLAYEMITKTSYPGFGDWIQRGATTLWQTWEGDMSRNHIMFGSVDEWFFEGLAGIRIDPENPGFKHFYLEPQVPEELENAGASHHSMYGMIKSHWEQRGNEHAFNFTVPFNTRATITLPVDEGHAVLENGRDVSEHPGIEVVARKEGKIMMKVAAGKYAFSVG